MPCARNEERSLQSPVAKLGGGKEGAGDRSPVRVVSSSSLTTQRGSRLVFQSHMSQADYLAAQSCWNLLRPLCELRKPLHRARENNNLPGRNDPILNKRSLQPTSSCSSCFLFSPVFSVSSVVIVFRRLCLVPTFYAAHPVRYYPRGL